MHRRRRVAVVVATLAAIAASPAAADHDAQYVAANERLARATPTYPRARLLVEEPVGGWVEEMQFDAVMRVSFLAQPRTQRRMMTFYARKLGAGWRRRGPYCLVSRSRSVAIYVSTRNRRLGLLIDSRGAPLCEEQAGLLSDFVEIGDF